jgi:hypothetical protein
LTSNVTDEEWRARKMRSADPVVRLARLARPHYSSSMCSNDSPADLAERLGSAIDEVAAVADGADQPDAEVAARLAAAWALITAADPELAERTARY